MVSCALCIYVILSVLQWLSVTFHKCSHVGNNDQLAILGNSGPVNGHVADAVGCDRDRMLIYSSRGGSKDYKVTLFQPDILGKCQQIL